MKKNDDSSRFTQQQNKTKWIDRSEVKEKRNLGQSRKETKHKSAIYIKERFYSNSKNIFYKKNDDALGIGII